jgi:hypothetical protein
MTNGSGGTSLKVRFGDDSDEGLAVPLTLPLDSGANAQIICELFSGNAHG